MPQCSIRLRDLLVNDLEEGQPVRGGIGACVAEVDNSVGLLRMFLAFDQGEDRLFREPHVHDQEKMMFVGPRNGRYVLSKVRNGAIVCRMAIRLSPVLTFLSGSLK